MYMVTPRHMGPSQVTFSGMGKTASTCCSLNSPPFFTKSLRQTTTGDEYVASGISKILKTYLWNLLNCT